MKNTILYLLFFVFTWSACSKDELPISALEGVWYLTYFEGMEGSNNSCQLPKGLTRMYFTDNEIYVQVNFSLPIFDFCDIMNSGIFSYQIIERDNKRILLVDGVEEGEIDFSSERLTINSFDGTNSFLYTAVYAELER